MILTQCYRKASTRPPAPERPVGCFVLEFPLSSPAIKILRSPNLIGNSDTTSFSGDDQTDGPKLGLFEIQTEDSRDESDAGQHNKPAVRNDSGRSHASELSWNPYNDLFQSEHSLLFTRNSAHSSRQHSARSTGPCDYECLSLGMSEMVV